MMKENDLIMRLAKWHANRKGFEIALMSQEILKQSQLETEMNNKWAKHPIIYKAREDKIHFDVRNFITPKDYILEKVIKDNNLKRATYDQTAYECMKFVMENVKWVSDNKKFGFNENWDFPAEVLLGEADCEGGTHLMISLMRNAGVPAFRVKAAVGWAIDNKGNRIGHSRTIYSRETDNEWIDLDWCFFPSLILIRNRIMSKNNKTYGDIWFTFNDEYSWAQSRIELLPDETKKIREK